MSIFKISKISLITLLFFTLQLGACAKEVPTTVAQETATEQAAPIANEPIEQVIQTNTQVKKDIVLESEPAIRVAETRSETLERETNQAKIAEAEIKETVLKESVLEKSVIEKSGEALLVDTPELAKTPQVTTQVQTQLVEKTASQEMLNLEQYKGKVVYLDFWASWCVPCQQTFPWMDAMQKKYPDDIVFVAVNFGESPEDTKEFLKRFPADIIFVYDPLIQIGSEYDIPGLPYSFIYGRNGELLGKHAGFAGGSAVNLEAALNKLFESGL